MSSWTILDWAKAGAFSKEWAKPTTKKDVITTLSPVASSSYALSEGLCQANSMLKIAAVEGEDQYVIAFVGSNFSTGECTTCGCVYDLYYHASSLAADNVGLSVITSRPSQSLRKLWEAARMEPTKEKALAQLNENEYKYFVGHRLPWTANVAPPGYTTQQGQHPSAVAAKPLPTGYPPSAASSSVPLPLSQPKSSAPPLAPSSAPRPPGTTPYATPTTNAPKAKFKVVRRGTS